MNATQVNTVQAKEPVVAERPAAPLVSPELAEEARKWAAPPTRHANEVRDSDPARSPVARFNLD